jgi:hypothetical protein
MPDRDDVFEILRCRRRRLAIQVLDEASEPVSLGELAERVAARELDIPRAALTSAPRKNVYTALYQTHLSKLEQGDAIDLVDGQDAIRPGPAINVYLHHIRVSQLRSLVGRAVKTVRSFVARRPA